MAGSVARGFVSLTQLVVITLRQWKPRKLILMTSLIVSVLVFKIDRGKLGRTSFEC